jgi:hypothetical protein
VWAAVVAIVGILILCGTLLVTRAQTTNAQKELELSERPWVFVKNICPTGEGLTYGKWGARFNFQLVLANIGHSPAAATWIYLEAYKPTTGQKIDSIAAQRRVCAPVKKRISDAHGLGYTLFPGQEKSLYWDVYIPPNALIPNFIGPQTMVGCVDYEFEFAKGHHQTPIIFSVMKRREGFPPEQGFALETFEAVPAKNLLLQEWIESGANAD